MRNPKATLITKKMVKALAQRGVQIVFPDYDNHLSQSFHCIVNGDESRMMTREELVLMADFQAAIGNSKGIQTPIMKDEV